LDFISKSTSAYIKYATAHLLYAQANLETKRKAFERLEISSKIKKLPRWKRDASLLVWLDTL